MPVVTFSNPPTVHAPGRYSHAALISGATRRLIISGQVGVTPDGTVLEGVEAQMKQALANIGAILVAHDMTPGNIVKMTTLLKSASLVEQLRTVRAPFFGDHIPASSLIIVPELADPRHFVEIEAEAVA